MKRLRSVVVEPIAAKAANEGLGGHGVASKWGKQWPAAEGAGWLAGHRFQGIWCSNGYTYWNKCGCVTWGFR